MTEKDEYIWCPKSAATDKEGKSSLKLIRKNPRACRENCSKKHKCKPYQDYWQYDLFEFLNKTDKK